MAAFVATPEWPGFRQALIGLTDVTRSHFDKLVEVWLRAWSHTSACMCTAAACRRGSRCNTKP